MSDLIAWVIAGFSALQRAENSSIALVGQFQRAVPDVSVLFSEPKIPQSTRTRSWSCCASVVSVLFSEPKSPQFVYTPTRATRAVCFSALQRAENSSISLAAHTLLLTFGFSALQRAENSSMTARRATSRLSIEFQCSSASRKFLNSAPPTDGSARYSVSVLFSEPKIPQSNPPETAAWRHAPFQCSSASRKFLNLSPVADAGRAAAQFQCSSASRKFLNRTSRGCRRCCSLPRFSALQRAENSSIIVDETERLLIARFSFSALQRAENSSILDPQLLPQVPRPRFSALQRAENSSMTTFYRTHDGRIGFSALQRAENSSMVRFGRGRFVHSLFQCSSASRKFLNSARGNVGRAGRGGFSALQRAENSSIFRRRKRVFRVCRFQCSSASRKFLNSQSISKPWDGLKVSVLFSEPKIPQCEDRRR